MLVQPLGATPARAGASVSPASPLATAAASTSTVRRRGRPFRTREASMPEPSDEAEIVRAESMQVREDRAEIGAAHAEPLRQGRGVLIDADARDHLPAREIVRRGQALVRESRDLAEAVAVELAAVDRTAERELDSAPPVVRARTVRLQRAREFGSRERRYRILQALYAHFGPERAQRIVDLGQHPGVVARAGGVARHEARM